MRHKITVDAIQYTSGTEQEIIDLLKRSGYELVFDWAGKHGRFLQFIRTDVTDGLVHTYCLFDGSWVVPNLEFNDEYLFIPNDEFIKRFNYDTKNTDQMD